MQKNFLMILALVLFISCNSNERKPAKDKKNEHLPLVESILIPVDSADAWIYNYHHYRTHVLNQPLGKAGFVVDANALRELLINNHNIKTMNFYLARKSSDTSDHTDSTLTLVYVGARDSAGFDVEEPYRKQDDSVQYMFDQVMPCPICDKRIRLYHHPNADTSHQ